MNKVKITGLEVNLRSGPGLVFNIVGKGRRDEEHDWLMTMPDITDTKFNWHASARGWSRSDLSTVVESNSSGSGSSGQLGLRWPRPTAGDVLDDYHPPSHRGIDIATWNPGPVYGISGAVVHKVFRCTVCGTDPFTQSRIGDFSAETGYGFGNHIILNKDGVYVLYAHLQSINVEVGNIVGDAPIGKMGLSGNASGWHLHLEVRKNAVFDKSMNGLINPREKFAI